MLQNLKNIAKILETVGYTTELIKLENLILFLEDIPENISLDDVKQNPFLGELVIYSDRITNAIDYRALEWLKSR